TLLVSFPSCVAFLPFVISVTTHYQDIHPLRHGCRLRRQRSTHRLRLTQCGADHDLRTPVGHGSVKPLEIGGLTRYSSLTNN
ncbi:hypothetical protein V1517DRAFT_376162, partial [Lipomyces orientalis]